MIFISAGHVLRGPKSDPGALGKNTTEARETAIFRDLVCRELNFLGAKFIRDDDTESLGEYLTRIKTGSGSVVLDIHFNAANGKATGTEMIVESDADRLDLAFARELSIVTSKLLQIPNRGVKGEQMTARGRLGLMREEGIICLAEICFIDNEEDMRKYRANIIPLSKEYAKLLVKYEQIIP